MIRSCVLPLTTTEINLNLKPENYRFGGCELLQNYIFLSIPTSQTSLLLMLVTCDNDIITACSATVCNIFDEMFHTLPTLLD